MSLTKNQFDAAVNKFYYKPTFKEEKHKIISRFKESVLGHRINVEYLQQVIFSTLSHYRLTYGHHYYNKSESEIQKEMNRFTKYLEHIIVK